MCIVFRRLTNFEFSCAVSNQYFFKFILLSVGGHEGGGGDGLDNRQSFSLRIRHFLKLFAPSFESVVLFFITRIHCPKLSFNPIFWGIRAYQFRFFKERRTIPYFISQKSFCLYTFLNNKAEFSSTINFSSHLFSVSGNLHLLP